ncbi:Bbp19 family protein [Roseateles sp. PN1]|uniref:Bbp19 family protein n=1 Tax=Roseateles sp. PN1 TaxID=3137372 RepID=UPI00313A3EB3
MATPQQYQHTFDLTNDGQAVLDDLMQIFGNAPFVPGKPDQTAYNCGARAVIEHIHAMLSQSGRP